MKYIKEAIPYVIIIGLVLLVRAFVITPVLVVGDSMDNTLAPNQLLILKKYDKNFSRFDIVAIKYDNEKLIKRIIGLPGETIAYIDNDLYINGKKIEEPIQVETEDFTLEELGYSKIPEDYYLVLGDNRPISIDSRIIGLIPKKDILGTTSFRIWPFNKFGSISK